MRNGIILLAMTLLSALVGCNRNQETSRDLDSQSRIEYVVDYSVSFAADSTMQLSASSNHGVAKIVSVPFENLLDADDRPVKNTFIILEDSVPMGKSLTLRRGDLSYTGGNLEYIHNQVVGSDDLVELRILGTDTLTHSHSDAFSTTLYSIRDNMFYDPYDAQSITIPGGHRFSAILSVITEEMYPKEKENHSIKIEFSVATNGAK